MKANKIIQRVDKLFLSQDNTNNNLENEFLLKAQSQYVEKFKQIASFFNEETSSLKLKSPNKVTYYKNMAKITNINSSISRPKFKNQFKKKEFIPIGDIIENARETYNRENDIATPKKRIEKKKTIENLMTTYQKRKL